ncbi:AbrB/MazE/SpoVT family DNA-binding domain-containing protein [Anoxybacteroides tepidamans]|uniref:AbrB/MazE/SpoVT family DNA-binding domain-containing protein n=1 Tax=Anoxybacteroides tepidamans TaxID=265948 RepID=UPI000486B69C|nr:AbrB/MazE/SpoVT family DNA-binding domain-containing protein [Anoxybacillus tepidamans]
MKSTGIVRKVDELGRVVIPMELRKILDIKEKDPIEIFVDGDKIILQKYVPSNQCLITGECSDNNLVLFDGKLILSNEGAKVLLDELKNQLLIKQ